MLRVVIQLHLASDEEGVQGEQEEEEEEDMV